MFDRAAFEEHLVWAEAEKLMPYKCSAGKLTIGVGRNLTDRGITQEESRFLLKNDIDIVLAECGGLDYWDALDPARRMVVADMVFNLGLARFLKFKKTNAALLEGDYEKAAVEMEDSSWYRQVGRRAVKLQKIMRQGDLDV